MKFEKFCHAINEADQELVIYGEDPSGMYPLYKIALGTENIIWESGIHDPSCVPDTLLDEMLGKSLKEPIAIPSNVVGDLRRLALLNEDRQVLIDKIQKNLDERYDLGISDMTNDPLSDLTTDSFVCGEVRPSTRRPGASVLNVGDECVMEDHPGKYVAQIIDPYTESYKGTIFMKMWGDGRYVKIPFEE